MSINTPTLKQMLLDQWNRTSSIAKHNWENWQEKQRVGIVDSNNRPYLDSDAETPHFGDKLIAYSARYPVRTGAAVLGAMVANQMLGKPVEGLVDLVTFNAGNFRPDTHLQAYENEPVQVAGRVPQLNEKEVAYEVDRLQKNIARDMLTLKELQAIQNGGY